MGIHKFIAAAAFFVALTGCAKDWSNPEEFMRGPGAEALEKCFRPKGMERFGFKGFEFKDCTVKRDTFTGEFVDATLTIKTDDGVRYFEMRTLSPNETGVHLSIDPKWRDRLAPYLDDMGADGKKLADWYDAVESGRLQPLFCGKEVNLSARLEDFIIMRVFREKDPDGNYVVVEDSDRRLPKIEFFNVGGDHGRCSPNIVWKGIVSSRLLAERGGENFNTPEGKALYDAFVGNVAAIGEKIKELEAVCARLAVLDNEKWIKDAMAPTEKDIDARWAALCEVCDSKIKVEDEAVAAAKDRVDHWDVILNGDKRRTVRDRNTGKWVRAGSAKLKIEHATAELERARRDLDEANKELANLSQQPRPNKRKLMNAQRQAQAAPGRIAEAERVLASLLAQAESASGELERAESALKEVEDHRSEVAGENSRAKAELKALLDAERSAEIDRLQAKRFEEIRVVRAEMQAILSAACDLVDKDMNEISRVFKD